MFIKFNAVFFLVLASAWTGETKESPSLRKMQDDRICSLSELSAIPDDSALILSTMPHGSDIMKAYEQYMQGEAIGSNTAFLAESCDASTSSSASVRDGTSGDTDFPFMDMKVLASVGERSICPDSIGEKLAGVPDGVGAYLKDDETVRIVVQSESYGPLRYETYGLSVNDGAATIGGSKLQYIDYDRSLMNDFMDNDDPASSMVVGFGQVISTAYNLKGELIGPRSGDGPTTTGAHFSNTDAEGNYVVESMPLETDWFYQSFCSAHLEEKHQWGENLGVEDDMFITNEEWINYAPGASFVGLSAHAVDLETGTAYALGAFTQGGFEKIVEINPEVEGVVMFAISGYTGNFEGYEACLDKRNEMYTRSDGKNYTWTNDIVPARIYVGVKGKMEDGSDGDDFLARNGLRYGYIYGFTIDMSESGPTGGLWRDDFHRDPDQAKNGAKVDGWWLRQKWSWDGIVRNFEHDGSWDFQDKPAYTNEGSGREDHEWWTGMGPDTKACKTEHHTPDPRVESGASFIQSSTCGYFGHYYVADVKKRFSDLKEGQMLPNGFRGSYYVYQGELDVSEQIELGDKGQYVQEGTDATMNYANIGNEETDQEPIATFEDIDGFEVVEDNGKLYAIIQEDSGNMYGERMLMTPLEHDGEELTYYFLAMSGGKMNTRMVNGVSVPMGTFSKVNAHEFSGVFDASSFFLKDSDGNYVLSASDDGKKKREADAMVGINDKSIIVNLQAHTQNGGVLSAFQLDRGGQIYLMKPDIPME